MLLLPIPTQAAALLLGVLLLAPSLIAAQSNSKPGCPNTCGNLTIPYPFGLAGQADRYLDDNNRLFLIDCDMAAGPPTPYWQDKSTNIRITDISIVDHEMQIMVYVAHDCYNGSGSTRNNTPYLRVNTFPISRTRNMFTAIGCDMKAELRANEMSSKYVVGCLSQCGDISDVVNGTCSGIGCCQTNIPRNMTQFEIVLTSLEDHSEVSGFNPCSYAFVAENSYFGNFNFSTNYLREGMNETMVPLVMDWSIGNQTCDEAQKNKTSYACQGGNTNCSDAENGTGYRCHCREGYQGNPYLPGSDGCQDIDECKTANPCNVTSTCVNLPGTFNCSCPHGHEGDGLRGGTGCTSKVRPEKYTSRDIAIGLGLGVGCGMLLLSTFCVLQKRKEKIEREKFFKDNGGLMLQGLISQHQSHVEILKVFTAEELRKATDNYHESRILGQGGQGTVYKGTVMNNRAVAIKKAKQLERSQVDDFINEIIVLSQINHKNVVKLIGCCLEMELPLLVYEFVTNGTLSEHLHDSDRCSTSLSTWGARLRVAAETAGALSYLHSDAAIPIFHRDVKSANILLDENYTAKVSDFGASRLIPVDQTQLSTLVQGTFGYIDPEYFHTSQLTEKSDVYSFGVVLAELLTGLRAVSFSKPENERNLSLVFVMAVKEDRILEIIDKRILNEGNVDRIREVVGLASRCLKIRGEDRPSMKEVALELEGFLRVTNVHPWKNQETENFRDTKCLPGDGRMDSADIGSISTTVSEDTMKGQILPFHINDAR